MGMAAMTNSFPTIFPPSAASGADVAEIANELIAAIGVEMLSGDASAVEISYMRRSIITAVSEFSPFAFRGNSRWTT
jgi:hypothetical protein